MSRTTTPRPAPRHKNSRSLPKDHLDFIFANYGFMNYKQIAIKLEYFDKNGLPHTEKIKQVVLKRSTSAQKLEYEKRFQKSGIRGSGKRFKGSAPDPSPHEIPAGVLWGNPKTDYYFFPSKA